MGAAGTGVGVGGETRGHAAAQAPAPNRGTAADKVPSSDRTAVPLSGSPVRLTCGWERSGPAGRQRRGGAAHRRARGLGGGEQDINSSGRLLLQGRAAAAVLPPPPQPPPARATAALLLSSDKGGSSAPEKTKSTPCWYSSASIASRMASPSPCGSQYGSGGRCRASERALARGCVGRVPAPAPARRRRLRAPAARRLHCRAGLPRARCKEAPPAQAPPHPPTHLVGVVGVVPGRVLHRNQPGRARAVHARQVPRQPAVLLAAPAVGCGRAAGVGGAGQRGGGGGDAAGQRGGLGGSPPAQAAGGACAARPAAGGQLCTAHRPPPTSKAQQRRLLTRVAAQHHDMRPRNVIGVEELGGGGAVLGGEEEAAGGGGAESQAEESPAAAAAAAEGSAPVVRDTLR